MHTCSSLKYRMACWSVFGFVIASLTSQTIAGTLWLVKYIIARRLKERGYKIHFFFLMLPTVGLALTRIRRRVLEGGHDIPEPVVRRRFDRSIQNFFTHYRQLGDSWILFDNSGATPAVVALDKQGKPHIMNGELYETLITRYGRT
jgi:predicted ABC-type ATPase